MSSLSLKAQQFYYPSYASNLSLVQENGLYLQLIDQQDKMICETAIANNPRAIKFVKNQTFDLCMKAVQKKW